jgi:hypothetical protein
MTAEILDAAQANRLRLVSGAGQGPPGQRHCLLQVAARRDAEIAAEDVAAQGPRRSSGQALSGSAGFAASWSVGAGEGDEFGPGGLYGTFAGRADRL